MNEWIITTAVTLAIGAISYFLKRTISQVDRQGEEIQKLKNECITRDDLKEITEELKREIRKIREDYTPKEIHQKNFDECRKEIKDIREKSTAKEDFIREFSKLDQKLDRMMDMMIEQSRKWRDG